MFFTPRGKSNGTMIGKFFENSINPLIGRSIRQTWKQLVELEIFSVARQTSFGSNKFDKKKKKKKGREFSNRSNEI